MFGELPLQEAVASNILSLKEQIEQLNGFLELSKQIASEGCETLDTPWYWEIIHKKEAEGQGFADIVNEYWFGFLEPELLKKFGLVKIDSFKTKLIQIALVIVGVALVQTFIFQNGTIFRNLFYVPMIVAGLAVTIVGGAILLAVGGLLMAGWNVVFS